MTEEDLGDLKNFNLHIEKSCWQPGILVKNDKNMIKSYIYLIYKGLEISAGMKTK